ncbi:glycosyltransferase family 4 protein [Clostridium sp. OM02-18AC]|uniref:glycosyltransferase family 4 protein n=1 Tax=Clostridium sp. OM02-18AC TaxID=2292311 RepID=UPI0015FD47DE|nr:glycosyltransferase family 4 protein [Clostridium sp. OM02-18AC]
MKKALLVTHVSGFVPQFEMNNVRILQHMGYEVHYASNFHNPSYGDDNSRLEGTGIVCHQIDFARSPLKIENIIAYKQLKHLMQTIHFELVHCHTPVGGVLARLAAHATHTGPVIYTVHGFHFYTGAPIRNWLLYYPIERFLARYTDMLITINEEDYQRAETFSAKPVRRIHGVGMSLEKKDILLGAQLTELRKKLGLEDSDFIIVSAGELNKNKNQIMVLKALSEMETQNYCYLVCGKGPLKEKLETYVKEHQMQDRVRFLGYRKDLENILQLADLFVMPSMREGMPTAVMEAMKYQLPVVGTNIRGNRELIVEGKTGYLVPLNDSQEMAKKILDIMDHPSLKKEMGERAAVKITEYSSELVEQEMLKNYKEVIAAYKQGST